jgi:hypothetical protein
MKKFKYLLLCKWISINLFGIVLLTTAYFNGLVDIVRIADTTFITEAIFALFLWGWVLSATKVWYIGKEIDKVKNNITSKWVTLYEKSLSIDVIESIKLKIINKIQIINWFSNVVVILGLVGTVVGFIIALSGVDPSIASDVSAVGPMVATLISGMKVALYTTLVGAIFHIWLSLNYFIVASGASTLISSIMENKKYKNGSV